MRVLLIEDDPLISENTKLILERHQFEVTILNEGSGAYRFVKENPPELILMDVMMPGKNGYEVCQEIKNDPSTKMIPLILISAKNQPEDIEKGTSCGANGYLKKPCRSDELINAITTLLKPEDKNKIEGDSN